MHFLSACLLGCCLVAGCQASELYTFTYDAATGPIQSFSFSFTAPTFLTDGATPVFSPFTVTDGANNWNLTNGWVTTYYGGIGCFLLGTPNTYSAGAAGPCQLTTRTPGAFGLIDIFMSGGIPSEAGVYPTGFFIGYFTTDSVFERIGPPWAEFENTGQLTLAIADVATPEPASLGFVAIGLIALAAALARRKLQRS